SSCSQRPDPLRSTLVPYTTLFRSRAIHAVPAARERARLAVGLVHDAHLGHHPAPIQGQAAPGVARGHDVDDFRLEVGVAKRRRLDRKSTRLNSSHVKISYAVFCLK